MVICTIVFALSLSQFVLLLLNSQSWLKKDMSHIRRLILRFLSAHKEVVTFVNTELLLGNIGTLRIKEKPDCKS